MMCCFIVCCCRDVDSIHDIMEDVAEQQDLSREISDAISSPIGVGKWIGFYSQKYK